MIGLLLTGCQGLTRMGRVIDTREGEVVVLSDGAAVVRFVGDKLLVAAGSEGRGVRVCGVEAGGFSAEPVAARVAITMHHGDFDTFAQNVFQIGDVAAERVPSAFV